MDDPQICLAAAGQLFFSSSVGRAASGMGFYVSKYDLMALSGLTTAATNEWAEVVLGSSIAIPAAATFFGVAGLTTLAQSGAFNIGFATMPVVFQQLPMGRLLGALWFGLLFLAGITSSVAMLTPVIAFFREEFGFRRETVAWSLGLVTFAYGLMHIAWLEYGFLDEWDYWAGTFGLVVMAVVETIIFIWVFRPENAWRSIHDGADIRLPQVFKFIMQWVTPLYLLVILGWWGIQNALPFLTLERSAGVGQVPEEADPYILMARAILPFFVVALAVLVHVAGKRGTGVREGNGFSLAELESQESTGRAG